MKIPIFEEVALIDFSYDYLISVLEESKIGRVPTYINLLLISKTDLNALIPLLEEVFRDLKLHPRFPYPTYLICNFNQKTIFPIVKSTKLLPDHFFKKVKRPNNKELQLLNKLGLKVDKLNNLDKIKILEQFSDTSYPQKILYDVSKELYFHEAIFHHFENQKQEKKRKSVTHE